MLLEFSVENFLSIKDRVTLSMVASKDKSLDYNIIKFDKINLLKSAVIYGPNASGKTNVLRAISGMYYYVRNSHKNQPGEEIEFTPFRLDEAYKERPSRFEMVFEIDNIKYIYGFSSDQKIVHKEYLYYYPKGRPAIIFDRHSANDYTFTKDKTRQNEIKKNTPENTLYLSKSANLNYEETSKVMKWFMDKIRPVISQDTYLSGFSSYTKKILAKDDSAKKRITKFVSKADGGIVGLRITNIEIGDDFLKDIPREIRDQLIEQESKQVKAIHIGQDLEKKKVDVAFSMQEEASGTQKMFNIAGPFMDVLSNGRILLIDELEANLHPHLVRYLVNIFNNPEYNKKGAQLIFSTHNTSLLDLDLFRRDQIWFTEKGIDQGTNLYSLYDYKARKDENVEKRYLTGRYGAIPLLD